MNETPSRILVVDCLLYTSRPASASSTSRCCFAFKRYLTSLRSKVSVNEAIVSSQGPRPRLGEHFEARYYEDTLKVD